MTDEHKTGCRAPRGHDGEPCRDDMGYLLPRAPEWPDDPARGFQKW